MVSLDLFHLWNREGSLILFHPSAESDKRERVEKILHATKIDNHLFIETSGSTSEAKWVALSKRALLHSAKSVNDHLAVTSNDRWVHALPTHHVGGLSIYARAFLSHSPVIDILVKDNVKWDPLAFLQTCRDEKGTITALVPTQLYDLVTNELAAPSSMRAAIIGGAKLDSWLYFEAKRLGWNPLPSYGMTECSSQIATAPLASINGSSYPKLHLLSHVIGAKRSREGRLVVKSDALLTCYVKIFEETFTMIDPKQGGWFQTEDIVEINGNTLLPQGRSDDVVIISGENVNLSLLNETFRAIARSLHLTGEQLLLPLPHRRRGTSIHLFEAKSDRETLDRAVALYNERVIPLAKIDAIHSVDSFPRNSLQKIQLHALKERAATAIQ